MGLFDYLEKKDIDIASINIWDLGQIPFKDVFPNASECDVSNFDSDAYPHLPYKFVDVYRDSDSLIWKCTFCGF